MGPVEWGLFVSIPYRKYKKCGAIPHICRTPVVSIPYRKYKKQPALNDLQKNIYCFHPL